MSNPSERPAPDPASEPYPPPAVDPSPYFGGGPLGPPLEYYGAGPSFGPPKLRGGAKALAIIGIILGSLGVLGTLCGLPQYFVQIGPPNPGVNVIRNDSFLFPYTIAAMAVGFVMACFLLAGCIQSMQLRRSGPRIMVRVAWVQIALAVIAAVVSFSVTFPKMRAAAARSSNAAAMEAGLKLGALITIPGLLLVIVYYGLVIYLFNRPHVLAQFQPGGGPGADPSAGYGYPPGYVNQPESGNPSGLGEASPPPGPR